MRHFNTLVEKEKAKKKASRSEKEQRLQKKNSRKRASIYLSCKRTPKTPREKRR